MPERPRAGAVDIDAQDLAEQLVRDVLAVGERIARAAAVAGPEVQVPVRPEGHGPAVVVRILAVLDVEEVVLAPETGRGARLVGRQARDPDVATGPRVVDVDVPVRCEIRVECQAEQPPLAARRDARPDIEERAGDGLAGHDPDLAALLDDEESPRSVARMGDPERAVEPTPDLDDGQLAAGQRGRRPDRDRFGRRRDLRGHAGRHDGCDEHRQRGGEHETGSTTGGHGVSSGGVTDPNAR